MTTTSQLTGSDEREKRKKRASTDRRGLHGRRGQRLTVCTVCTARKLKSRKLKSNVGSNFSHTVVLSPLWLRGPLTFGPYPCAPSLFRPAIAITFPLYLVPAR